MSSPVADFRPSPTARTGAEPERPWIRTQDVGELAEPLTNLILKYPSAALATAFLVGVVVAWWIKRR